MSFPRRRESRGRGGAWRVEDELSLSGVGMYVKEAVLRLHPCQQEKRHPLHRRDLRPPRRRAVYQHKHDLVGGFTQKYQIHKLVYYETADDVNAAITREKQLKKWKRAWKIRIIEEKNPGWEDLYLLIG